MEKTTVALKIKAQKDYLVTEVSLDLPADPKAADEIMKALKANGKMVVQYNGGNCPGINLEQKTRIPEALASKVRSLIGVDEKKL
jgi:hypothetical protein